MSNLVGNMAGLKEGKINVNGSHWENIMKKRTERSCLFVCAVCV